MNRDAVLFQIVKAVGPKVALDLILHQIALEQPLQAFSFPLCLEVQAESQ